jgi:hypothetical protein
MQRLDWTIDPDGSLNASADGWHYEIIPHEDGVSDECSYWWDLTCSRNGSDESKWFLARYLEDAMALATAIAAGVVVE